MIQTAAMCIAVGKVSLELWDMFTWSLGWTSRFSSAAWQRWEITSLTFIFDCVPLPVCQTFKGNSPSHWCAEISQQAAVISSHRFSSSFPNS